MKKNADNSTCIYGASVLSKHIQAMRAEIEGVRQAQDIEYIHQMRVATRRLRASLPLFVNCLPSKRVAGWEKDIRAITKALGAARDADVQIEHVTQFQSTLPVFSPYRSGIRRLLLRLNQGRKKMQAKIDRALDRMEESHVLDQLEKSLQPYTKKRGEVAAYGPDLYRLSFNSIEKQLDALLAYDAIVYLPEKVEELHAMRIAAKQLRYTIENFAALYADELKTASQAVKQCQESLGNIHDCDVWVSFLPKFLEKERARTLAYYGSIRPIGRMIPGIQHFQQSRQADRNKEYQEFVINWLKWQAKGTWDELRQTIRLPLVEVARIYPPPGMPGPSATLRPVEELEQIEAAAETEVEKPETAEPLE